MITMPRLELVRLDSHATAEELQSLQTQLNAQFKQLRDQVLALQKAVASLEARVATLSQP